jgi:hypothetical protein
MDLQKARLTNVSSPCYFLNTIKITSSGIPTIIPLTLLNAVEASNGSSIPELTTAVSTQGKTSWVAAEIE